MNRFWYVYFALLPCFLIDYGVRIDVPHVLTTFFFNNSILMAEIRSRSQLSTDQVICETERTRRMCR